MQGKVFLEEEGFPGESPPQSSWGQETFSLTPPSLGLGVSSPGAGKPHQPGPPPPPSPQDSSLPVFPDLSLGDVGNGGAEACREWKPVHCAGRVGAFPPLPLQEAQHSATCHSHVPLCLSG